MRLGSARRSVGDHRQRVDLHAELAWQANVDRGPCGRGIAENGAIDRIHPVEIRAVREEDADPQHVVKRGAAGGEHLLDVAQALSRLGLDVGASEPARRRVVGPLPGGVNQTPDSSALGVRARGLWGT